MGILEEIREYFASTQNGAREIKTLPKEYSAMVIRDNEGYGVAIEFDDIRDISEKFANSRLFSRTLAIGGIEKKYLILSCMLDSLRYEFATVCAQFVEPGIDGIDRKNLMSEPLEWWKKWRELMGNTISNKEAYSVIAEMMVLDEMINLTNVPEEELSKHRINSKKYDNFLFRIIFIIDSLTFNFIGRKMAKDMGYRS